SCRCTTSRASSSSPARSRVRTNIAARRDLPWHPRPGVLFSLGSGRSLNFERRYFRRIGAVRMPEADRSAAAQKDFLALYGHFRFALKVNESAVGADVDQDEFFAPAFNPSVLARRLAVRYDDVAGVLPAEL